MTAKTTTPEILAAKQDLIEADRIFREAWASSPRLSAAQRRKSENLEQADARRAVGNASRRLYRLVFHPGTTEGA